MTAIHLCHLYSGRGMTIQAGSQAAVFNFSDFSLSLNPKTTSFSREVIVLDNMIAAQTAHRFRLFDNESLVTALTFAVRVEDSPALEQFLLQHLQGQS